MKPKKTAGYVIVRSYGAGVFSGKLKSRTAEVAGISVVLDDCIRLHRWTGCSLSQVARDGVAGTGENRFSVRTNAHEINGVIEIIPQSPASRKVIEEVKTWEI